MHHRKLFIPAFAFGCLASAFTLQLHAITAEEEETGRGTWTHSPQENPQVVSSDSDPRMGLLRMGFDLEEVAVMAPERAKEMIHAQHQVGQFAKLFEGENPGATIGAFAIASSGSSTGSQGIEASATPPAPAIRIIGGNNNFGGTRITMPTTVVRDKDMALASLVSNLSATLSIMEIWEIWELSIPPESRSYMMSKFTDILRKKLPQGDTEMEEFYEFARKIYEGSQTSPPQKEDLPINSNPFGQPDAPSPLPSGGTQDVIADASQLVNHLLTDVSVGSGEPNNNRVFNRARLVASGFNYPVLTTIALQSGHGDIALKIINYLKISKLPASSEFSGRLSDVFSDQVNTDILNTRRIPNVGNIFGLTTDDFAIFTAKDLFFEKDSVIDVSKWMGPDAETGDRSRVFAFGASDDVFVEGDVSITNQGHRSSDQALAIGGGGNVIIHDADLSYDGANLGLGAGGTVQIVKSSISTKGHLAIGALDRLVIEDVQLSAGEGSRVLLYADNTADFTGLGFSEGLRQVYVEAGTINLRDVNFPAGSEVRLVSQLGSLDGKYPNFGAIQSGRVNFLQNVSYGGKENVMHDKFTFDLFGQDISIEAFQQL